MKTSIYLILNVVLMLCSMTSLVAQSTTSEPLSLNQAINRALQSNFGIRTSYLIKEASAISNSWGAVGALPQLSTSVSGVSSISDQTENPTCLLYTSDAADE